MKAYYIKSKFGLGRDFYVYKDPAYEKLLYVIDGKIAFGLKAEVKDNSGQVLAHFKAPWFNIPRRMHLYDNEGTKLATIKYHISPLRRKLSMELANGDVWAMSSNLIGKTYSVNNGKKDIIVIDQKLITVRDKYKVEIDENSNVLIALGFMYAVDTWREDKGGA